MQWLKTKIRWLVLQIKWTTDKWVIPEQVYGLIEEGKHQEAKAIVEKQRSLYPYDPEITSISTLISFEQKNID